MVVRARVGGSGGGVGGIAEIGIEDKKLSFVGSGTNIVATINVPLLGILPTLPGHLSTKAYVDSFIAGFNDNLVRYYVQKSDLELKISIIAQAHQSLVDRVQAIEDIVG